MPLLRGISLRMPIFSGHVPRWRSLTPDPIALGVSIRPRYGDLFPSHVFDLMSTRQALSIFVELQLQLGERAHSRGVHIADVQAPLEPGKVQPIDCEDWLDVAAGMQIVWPNGAVETVAAVELVTARPATRRAIVTSARQWERTGLDVNGMPTVEA